MNEKSNFRKLAASSFKFKIFLLFKLPAAFFSGIRIREITDKNCITSVPYKWFTQNPFHSTYFASLAMAAEMSTGALVLMNIYKTKPGISLLITKMEASYFKKAKDITVFTCEEGIEIANAVKEAANTMDGKTITVRSMGRNENNELIAEFLFTWSFKVKKSA